MSWLSNLDLFLFGFKYKGYRYKIKTSVTKDPNVLWYSVKRKKSIFNYLRDCEVREKPESDQDFIIRVHKIAQKCIDKNLISKRKNIKSLKSQIKNPNLSILNKIKEL